MRLKPGMFSAGPNRVLVGQSESQFPYFRTARVGRTLSLECLRCRRITVSGLTIRIALRMDGKESVQPDQQQAVRIRQPHSLRKLADEDV